MPTLKRIFFILFSASLLCCLTTSSEAKDSSERLTEWIDQSPGNPVQPTPVDEYHFPPDEDGYEAWVRYTSKSGNPRESEYSELVSLYTVEEGPIVSSALAEWSRGIQGFTGREVKIVDQATDAAVIFEIDQSLGPEAYQITPGSPLRIIGGCHRGLLYGTFACLQKMQRNTPIADLTAQSKPMIANRMLNHWDNMVESPTQGSIERVRGGKTIFEWTDLSYPNPRYQDYARMLASIGINGVCLNNVNAEPEILASETIDGLAHLSKILRAYGIQTFLSVSYASPVLLGGLSTADPRDPDVERWWNGKADEIYAKIPDFGGFIVKADSEGRPGPGNYGLNHAEGSRTIARALQPHGGLVYWRAFVYGRADIAKRTPHERAAGDRANHASYEFMELDGKFEDNIILQIKHSAIDFQPNEPPHALFGLMPNTRLCVELDLPKEYKGYDTTIAWEGHYMSEILNFETYQDPNGATIAEIVAGKTQKRLAGGITAVANINNSNNWFGHLLSGATLYTYGRQAWDPRQDPLEILQSYAELTFGPEAAPVVVDVMDQSYATMCKYMGLLGNHSQSELLHHYEPDPWGGVFSKHAGITDSGIGVDRTVETGSAYLGLYHPKAAAKFENPETCPIDQILYFHHLPWTYELTDGRSLVQYLYDLQFEGVAEVEEMRNQWRSLLGKIDLSRWAHVYEKLAQQQHHAERWRDLMSRYYFQRSGIADEHKRIGPDNPSPHNRIKTGFWHAVEDYRARVKRLEQEMNVLIHSNKGK